MTLTDSLQNMFELFSQFQGFEDFVFNKSSNLSSIKAGSSDWPNYTYDLNLLDNGVDSIIRDIVLKIQKFEVSPFLLLLKDSYDIEENFYNHGIKKIETWPIMTINVNDLDVFNAKLSGNSDVFCLVETERDLSIWFNLVKKVLFNKRKLNIEHFRKMQFDKQFDLLLIKNQEEGIAASLVFSGDKYAGLYMVATEDSFRGKGYGKYITKKAVETAKFHGKSFLTLQSSRMAYQMYKNIGFKTLGEIDVYWMIGTQFK